MRIVHIDMGKEMRGGQHQVLLLLNGLKDAGHECVLLARVDGALWQAARAGNFSVYPATLRMLWRHSGGGAIVHAHDARGHTLAAVASRRIGLSSSPAKRPSSITAGSIRPAFQRLTRWR